MFSNQCFSFFDKCKSDHHTDGGPRCYIEFEYNKKRIVCVGDRHYSLPFPIVKQYQDAFNHLIAINHQKNSNTKIFIENTNNSTDADNDLDFLDGLSTLNHNDSTEIVLSDDRAWSDGLRDAINFFRKLAEFEGLVRAKLKNQGYSLPEVTHLPKNDEQINIILQGIAAYYEKKISFNECEKLFEKQLDHLIELLNKYEDKNLMLEKFISNSYSALYFAYEDFGKLKNDYELLYQNANIGEKNLDELAIQMINHDRHFESVGRLLTIFLAYVGPFLDATLACKLWEQIHNPDTRTIIICAGVNHIERLATWLQQFCQEIVNISKNNEEVSISPQAIHDYLAGNFQEYEDTKNQQCCII